MVCAAEHGQSSPGSSTPGQPNSLKQQSIEAKELLPIVMACMVWGTTWSKNAVLVHCANQAVVEVVNPGYCKDPQLMQLLRCLFFIITLFKISVKAAYIVGHRNTGADALSRENICTSFLSGPHSKQDLNFHPNSTDRASDPPTAGLDITSLVPTVHKLFVAGLVLSTKRAYHSGGVRYHKFCADAKVTPFPTFEKILLLFVGFLH